MGGATRRLSSDVGAFEVGERIGSGGMAEVFRARALGAAGFARPVAIKRVLPRLSRNARFADMFANEARLASLLHHPNIVAVQNFARDDEGQLFLVMELVEGVDTWALLASGPVPLACTSYIIGEVLRALGYAHACADDGMPLKIVHRDISPQNVLLSWDGAVKVSDFGLAKAVALGEESTAGVVKGKVGYLSPEQLDSRALDGRSDLFSTGVILHELLTGRPLFEGNTDLEVMRRMKTMTVPPPSTVNREVPRALDRVCSKLLERDRDRRYASADEALFALAETGTIPQLGAVQLAQLLRSRFPERAQSRGSGSRLPLAVSSTTIDPSVTVGAVEDEIESSDMPTDAQMVAPDDLLGEDAPTLPPPPARPSHEFDDAPPTRRVATQRPAPSAPPAEAFAPAPAPVAPAPAPVAPAPAPPPASRAQTVIGVTLASLALGSIIAGIAIALTPSMREKLVPGPPTVSAPAKAAPYVVRLDISPPEAIVEIDGTAVGTGPVLIQSYPRDGVEHTLRITAKDHKRFETRFKDAPPEERIALEPFRAEPPRMVPVDER